MSRLHYMVVAAAAVIMTAALFTAPAFAQGDGDAEEVSRERVRKMRDVTEYDGQADQADFGSAFESADDDGKREFIPKNQIIIMEVPAPDTVVGKKAEKKKSEKLGSSVGARLGLGNALNIGADVKLGMGEKERLDLGISAGIGIGNTSRAFEAFGFYEWRYSLSDDGVLGWYCGSGLVFGHYSASKDTSWQVPDAEPGTYAKGVNKDAGFNVALGAQVGLDVNLTFIDPDHSLYKLKNNSLGLDIRPVLYLPIIKNYPVLVVTLGISYRRAF